MLIDTPRLVSIAVLTGLFYRQLAYVQSEKDRRELLEADARHVVNTLSFLR